MKFQMQIKGATVRQARQPVCQRCFPQRFIRFGQVVIGLRQPRQEMILVLLCLPFAEPHCNQVAHVSGLKCNEENRCWCDDPVPIPDGRRDHHYH